MRGLASGREAQINAVAANRRTLLRRYLMRGTIALRDKVLEAYQPVVLLHARRVYRRQSRFTRLTPMDYEGQANLVLLELLADREQLQEETGADEQAFVELVSCRIRRQLTLVGIQTSSAVSLTMRQAWTVNRSHKEGARHYGGYEDLHGCLYSQEIGVLPPPKSLPESVEAIDEAAIAAHERTNLLRAVEQLPQPESRIVRLRYGIEEATDRWGGGRPHDLKEISAEVGISKSQVHRRLSRALSMLSRDLAEEPGLEPERVLRAS